MEVDRGGFGGGGEWFGIRIIFGVFHFYLERFWRVLIKGLG
jgi:hypothetical protein